MQCYICVMYMMLACSARPPAETTNQEPRSLFRDVIESLRIRSQIPDDLGQNFENNLAQNYENFDNEPPRLPSDTEFIPRRNDRIEMPRLKYRIPKSLNETNFTVDIVPTDVPKEEIVLYIDTNVNKDGKTTVKPKKNQKKPRPNNNKTKTKNGEDGSDDVAEDDGQPSEEFPAQPVTNTMAGQSQIGNRESQIVVKPTVIVNFRGSVSHRDSDIKLEGRNNEDKNNTISETPQNIFNINQEIKLERTFAGVGSRGGSKLSEKETKGDIKLDNRISHNVDPDIIEAVKWDSPKVERVDRKFDSVVQILVSV